MQSEGFAAGVQKEAGRLEGPPGSQEARGGKVSPAQCLLVLHLQLTGNRQTCMASFSFLFFSNRLSPRSYKDTRFMYELQLGS